MIALLFQKFMDSFCSHLLFSKPWLFIYIKNSSLLRDCSTLCFREYTIIAEVGVRRIVWRTKLNIRVRGSVNYRTREPRSQEAPELRKLRQCLPLVLLTLHLFAVSSCYLRITLKVFTRAIFFKVVSFFSNSVLCWEKEKSIDDCNIHNPFCHF